MKAFIKIIWGIVVCVGVVEPSGSQKSLLTSTKCYTGILTNFYCPISPKHYNMAEGRRA